MYNCSWNSGVPAVSKIRFLKIKHLPSFGGYQPSKPSNMPYLHGLSLMRKFRYFIKWQDAQCNSYIIKRMSLIWHFPGNIFTRRRKESKFLPILYFSVSFLVSMSSTWLAHLGPKLMGWWKTESGSK